MRKRRKRLRIDRVIYVFAIFVFIIFLIIFGIKSLLNLRIYNSIKNKGSVKLFKQEIKVWKKTENYVNDKLDEVTLTYKKNSVTIDSSYFKNGLNLKINAYTKNISNSIFDNVKGFYIDKSDLLDKSLKIKIKIPRYLYKYEALDVYGIRNKKDIVLISPKTQVEDKYITLKTNSIYDSYFITYISGKSISSSNNINIRVGEKRDLNVKISPSNSTNRDVKYKYDKKMVSLNGDIVTAKKTGKTTIHVYSVKDNLTKDINIKIKKAAKEVVKEEKKNEPVVETGLVEKDGISYVDGIMIVNKTYSLPSSYNPGGLTDEFMDAFYEMQAAASLDGISLFIASGFRSYDYQVDLYNAYVKRDGKVAADTYSARAGHSEHQTGLAADINAADSSFEDTPEAIWLDKNCYKYGFVIRFPKGKEAFTGYKYEPWHLRYVGKDIANKIHDAGGISLEEYYNITSIYKD